MEQPGVKEVARQLGQTPILTNPHLWALVLVTTGLGAAVLGLTSGVGIFIGGVIGVLALAIAGRLFDELRSPEYDGKIDPWSD